MFQTSLKPLPMPTVQIALRTQFTAPHLQQQNTCPTTLPTPTRTSGTATPLPWA